MNKGIRFGLGAISAAIVAGGLLAAPASAQKICNPVIHGSNIAVTQTGGVVTHAGSYACPNAQPRPQAEYLVFFDWDRSNITPAAERILNDAVASFGTTARVHVIGHTDTSGDPTYNQRLSIRRAQSVQSALVQRGIPAANITIEGKGETQLLVPTGPNVREPSNRRAQVLNRSAAPAS